MPNAPIIPPPPEAPLLLKAVTALALCLFMNVAVQSVLELRHGGTPALPWYPGAVLGTCVLGLAACLGIWKMRRLGVLAFILAAGAQNLVLVLAHLWNPASALLVPAVVTGVALSSLHRMR